MKPQQPSQPNTPPLTTSAWFGAWLGLLTVVGCGGDTPAATDSKDGGTPPREAGQTPPDALSPSASGGSSGHSGQASSTGGALAADAQPGAGGALLGAPDSSPGGGDGSAAVCTAEGESCAESVSSCCEDLICVGSAQSAEKTCRAPCTNSDGCATACCILFEDGESGFCAPAEQCQCAEVDDTCGGTSRCCDGLACSTFDDTGDFACKPTCSEDDECSTGCCRPISGTDESVCLPEDWCGR